MKIKGFLSKKILTSAGYRGITVRELILEMIASGLFIITGLALGVVIRYIILFIMIT